MTPESPTPLKRYSYKIALIRERILLYLRLLRQSENRVSALTEEVMRRFEAVSPSDKENPLPAALEILTGVLKENNLQPDERYKRIFSEDYRPSPKRTSMVYHDFDPKKGVFRNKRCTFILSLRRLVFFTLVLGSTAAGTWVMTKILSSQELTPLEGLIIAVFSFLFGWISINFWSVLLGFFLSMLKKDAHLKLPEGISPIPGGVKVALIMPVHNEEVRRIFAGLRAMVDTIKEAGISDHFDIFILSDSTSSAHLISEQIHWAKLCEETDGFGKVFYRHRKIRLHKKSGNVSDFCRRWGSQYKYMITLDADSLMGGELLNRLVNVMEEREDIGILQTSPMAVNQISLISRLQQFASHMYGPIFFAGLKFWQMDETGFWGHNAIVRIEPFMKYCALPKLSGGPPFGGEILSHDFVEAALMRRAGWGVWLAYELKDSFEELPPNLLEELSRDKRWCQGNIQHLRLMFMKGISFGHRLLFLQGNLFYFSSLMWCTLLVLMTVNAVDLYFDRPVYFLTERSLFPFWVVEHRELSIELLIVTAVFLFSSKIFSFIYIGCSRERAAGFGGVFRLFISVVMETLLSTILAPLRMLFHTWYCLLNLTGRKLTWGSQDRLQKKTTFKEAFRAHILGSVMALLWAFIAYAVSKTLFWWLSVIVVPLILAIPISMFFSYQSVGLFFRKWGIFLTPLEVKPTKVLLRHQELLQEK